MFKLAFAVIGLLFVIGCAKSTTSVVECTADAEFVPAGCCHPSTCVPIQNKSDCSDAYCTLDCQPGTLDCGYGSCLCVKGKCNAVFE